MITRNKLLSQAVDDCIKELYSLVQPSVDWDDFIEQNRIYSKKYKVWERFNHLFNNRSILTEKELIEYSSYPVNDWENKSITECIGPRPYEFYYLPRDVTKEVVESYVYAYRMDVKQEFLNNIAILKDYCRNPIVDKYIDDYTDENGNHHPGYRSYDHPDNLEKQIRKVFDEEILPDICEQYNKQYNLQTTGIESSVSKAYSQIFQNKFFEFLDMAGNFYEWNGDLNSFNMSVYLGPSPNSSKEVVIKNWKQYRNKDIEIDESKYKEEEDE